MKRPYQHPTLERIDNDHLTDERVSHPAYGLISAVRTTTGGRPNFMFGSDFPHAQTVTLRIERAYTSRNLSNDYHHSKDTLIEVEMTESQFAALPSMMGTSGVPCTLRTYRMKGIDAPLEYFPGIQSVRQRIAQFQCEVQKVTDAIDCKVEETAALIAGMKSLSKKDRDALIKQLGSLTSGITSSIPFIAEQFSEHVERELFDLTTNARALQASGPKLENLARDEAGDTPAIEQPAPRLTRRRKP